MANKAWIDLTEQEYRAFLWDERNRSVDRDDTLKVEHLVCLHEIAKNDGWYDGGSGVPEYSIDESATYYDADEKVVHGKVDHISETGREKYLYARVTLYYTEGSEVMNFIVNTLVREDGRFTVAVSPDFTDLVHIAVFITDSAEITASGYTTYDSYEFDV